MEHLVRHSTLIATPIAVALGLALLNTRSASAAEGPRQVLKAGRTQVVVEPWNRGLSIAVDGVTISRGSNVVVTPPPWTPHYYLGPSAAAVESATQGMVEGGTVLRIKHRGENDSFLSEETIAVTDGRVEQVFEGQFTKDEGEALIQWQIAGLDPTPIIGRPYKAKLTSGEVREGVVPVTAQSGDVGPSTLANGLEWIEFDSRIGPIRIRVESQGKIICYDYRKNRWADPARPLFWLGDLGTRFKKGDTLRYRIVFELPMQSTDVSAGEPVRASATIARRADAQTFPVEPVPTIIPRPKEAKYGPGAYRVASADDVWLERGLNVGRANDTLISYLVHDFAVHAPASEPIETRTPPPQAIVFAKSADALPAEGYRLAVTPEGVRIEATDEVGYRYAVQTLRQLTTRTSAGEVLIRAAEIRDWPSLSFRGVHLFTGGQGPTLHEKLIRNVIAPLKMNHIVLESEYIKWDSHPEIHHAEYGMSKDDVRKILATCRELGVEVSPLVMSLGHCQWMFENNQNLELAEDPDAKWTYCVTNPKTYEFIYQIYDEAVELFRPKYFHIGHDEFTHRGRVPFREESKKYTHEQLLVMDTQRHHAWFKERGIRLMMWGDMLLGPDEAPDAGNAVSRETAAKERAKLPKDIVIADWHYVDTDPAKYTSLATFRDDGFTTVAAGWWRPGNVVHLARAAYEAKSLGYLQTTWAGYSLDPARFEKEINQYAMYVLAAEAAWNADDPPDPASFPAGAYFLDLMGLSTLKPGNRAGWTADLSAACNCPLVAADASGWFELGPAHDLSAVPRGLVQFKGVRFCVGDPNQPTAPAAIVLRSKLGRTMPPGVEMVLGAKAANPNPARDSGAEQPATRVAGSVEHAKAAQLVILHGTNFPCAAGTKVAQYEVRYENGETATLDLVYGRNVLAYSDLTASAQAPIVWSGKTAAGEPVALRVVVWDNPQPEKPIRALVARSADATGALMILGVTGLDGEGAAEQGARP